MSTRSARYARNHTDLYTWEAAWSPLREVPLKPKSRKRSLNGLDAALMFILLALVGVLSLGDNMPSIPALSDTSPFATVREVKATPESISTWTATSTPDGTAIRLWPDSSNLRDFSLSFQAAEGRAPISWVLRAANRNTYYRMTLVRSSRSLKLTRSAVMNGQVTDSTEVEIPSVRPQETLSVEVRAEGDRFVTSINGAPADSWRDARLTAGGAGWIAGSGIASIRSATLTVLTRRSDA
jgi:hypothetical protein